MHIALPTIFAALLVASEVAAGVITPRSHHNVLARRINRKKRCIQRGSQTQTPVENHYTPTSSPAAAQTTPADNGGNNNNNNGGNNNNNNNNNNGGGNTGGTPQFGTIQVASDGPCGDPGATTDPSSQGGPNGLESWLTCGIRGGNGWVPPDITLSNIVYKDLGTVLSQPGSPFAACANVLSSFENMGGQTGIPPILLASISLQESGCDPNATGPNGEIGLMQITPDKCGNVSNCYDADTNISIGANYFMDVINGAGGNVASAMGQYNGWFPGMTEDDANNHPTCGSRNNLDYLQNVFNGFMQGVDPSSLQMGMYFNTNC